MALPYCDHAQLYILTQSVANIKSKQTSNENKKYFFRSIGSSYKHVHIFITHVLKKNFMRFYWCPIPIFDFRSQDFKRSSSERVYMT